MASCRAVIFICVLTAGAAGDPVDASERLNFSLLLGRPFVFGSGSSWRAGDRAGAMSLDLAISRATALVFTVGTVRGAATSYKDFHWEFDTDYLAAGIRLLSQPQGHLRLYVSLSYGVLRAGLREEDYNWRDGTTQVTRASGTGSSGVYAVGFIVTLPRVRLAVVGELSAVIPNVAVRGDTSEDVPNQTVASIGVRFPP